MGLSIFRISFSTLGRTLLTRYQRTISQHAQPSDEKTKDPTTEIIPLPDFDWRTTEPLKIRPFKPKYHLTMGK
jgi:hypothetical protein